MNAKQRRIRLRKMKRECNSLGIRFYNKYVGYWTLRAALLYGERHAKHEG